jgi:hypothetical protein
VIFGLRLNAFAEVNRALVVLLMAKLKPLV